MAFDPSAPIDDDEQLRSAKEALTAVRTILAIDSDCSKFFEKLGLFVLGKFAAQIESARVTRLSSDDWLGIRMDETEASKTTYFDSDGQKLKSYGVQTAFRIFGRVQINRDGPFFNVQSRAIIGGYAAGTLGSRIAQILHELAHMIYRPYAEGGQPLIRNDGGDSGQSNTNTGIVMNEGEGMANCRKEIDAYLNDPRYRFVEEWWAQENR